MSSENKGFTDLSLKHLINKIKSTFIKKEDAVSTSAIDIDTTPTEDSENLVTSGGVFTALGNKADKGTAEMITMPASSWSTLADSDPFKYSATATITTTLDTSKTVTLINNAPVLFAKYGFQISAVSGQNVTIIATTLPNASITITVEVM